MIKISIIKGGKVTHSNHGDSTEVEAWLLENEKSGVFGIGERPEVIDEVETGVILPAEYSILREDVTDIEAAKEAKNKAKKEALERIQAASVEGLNSANTIAGLKAVIKPLLQDILEVLK